MKRYHITLYLNMAIHPIRLTRLPRTKTYYEIYILVYM